MKEYNESMKEFFTLWTDLTFSMIKNPMETAAKAYKTEHFEKLYDIYSKNMSLMMEQFYRTPEFAAKSWDMFKGTRGFQKYFGEMVEAGLKNLNIPTSGTIDELSSRIDSLEDRLCSLEKSISEHKTERNDKTCPKEPDKTAKAGSSSKTQKSDTVKSKKS